MNGRGSWPGLLDAVLVAGAVLTCGGCGAEPPAMSTPSVDAATSSVTCGAGTVLQSNTCVVAPPPTITQARLTLLKVRYDLAKPAYQASPLPLQFGVTAHSADDRKPVTTTVAVAFDLVEANPADPARPRTCFTMGAALDLVGDGGEHEYKVDLLIPDESCNTPFVGGKYNLAVHFDGSNKKEGIDYPDVVFSSSAATSALNQACRKTIDPAASDPGKGCVYAIDVQPTPKDANGKPLLDLQLELTPDSIVATVFPAKKDPNVPVGKVETAPPSLVIRAAVTAFGVDPFKRKVDFAKVDPEFLKANPELMTELKFGMNDADLDKLDDLPAPVTLQYELAPVTGPDSASWQPISIHDPANADENVHVTQIALTTLEPGAANEFEHLLYIDGALRDKVSDMGAWAANDEFQVRGCLVVPFAEGGNHGDLADDDMEDGNDPNKEGNCKIFRVKLVRATPPAGASNSLAFNQEWTRRVGSMASVELVGQLYTRNTLNLGGARSDSQASLQLSILRIGIFQWNLFRAWMRAGALTALAQSYVDIGLEVFGVGLWGDQKTQTEYTIEKMIPLFNKSYPFPVLAVGYGPFQFGITLNIGGNLGITPSLTIAAKEGGEMSVPELAEATSNGIVTVAVTPTAGLTGSAFGGINLFVAKAGVEATLQIIELSFPVAANMRWGVTMLDGDVVKQLTIVNSVTLDLVINWLNISVDLVGKLGFIPLSFNLWRHINPPATMNLLTRQLGAPIVLQ